MPTQAELGWLAAMIDGDGSVTMSIAFDKRRGYTWYVPHVAVANTDPAIVAEVTRLLDAIGCRYHASVSNVRKGHFGKKDCWQIVVHHFQSIVVLLTQVAPYMKSVKGAKAELMLRWLAMRIPKRQRGANSKRAYTENEHRLAMEVRTFMPAPRVDSEGVRPK